MLNSDKTERKSRFGQSGKIGSGIFFELRTFLVLSRFPVLLFAVKQDRAFAGVFPLYVLERLGDKFFRCHNPELVQPPGIENEILVVAPLVRNRRKPRCAAGRFPPSDVPSPGESRPPAFSLATQPGILVVGQVARRRLFRSGFSENRASPRSDPPLDLFSRFARRRKTRFRIVGG